MIGELGLAILRYQSESKVIPDDLARALDRCMKEVRSVWPDITARRLQYQRTPLRSGMVSEATREFAGSPRVQTEGKL